jgi:uncharacterized protein DUF3352
VTKARRRYLIRRIVASVVVAAAIGVGLARAFAGGTAPPAPDNAAAFVPSNALVYMNLGTDRGSVQWKRTAAAMRKLPLLGQMRDALLSAATGSALGSLSLQRDVQPWLGKEAAYAELPSGQSLLLLRVRDPKAALASIERAAGTTPPATYRGALLRQVGSGSVAALSGGWAFMGSSGAVRAALDTRAKPSASLGQSQTYDDLTNGLPNARVGNAWLSGTWLQQHAASPLAILAGAARVRGIESAAVGFGDDGQRIRVALRGRATPGAPGGPGCTGEAGQSGTLFSKAPAHPALFVGLAGAECILRDLMASPRSGAGRLLNSFATRAQRAGVNMDRDLLPLLGGDSAFSVTPGPTITLDAGEVPSDAALSVLGRLQPVLIDMLRPEQSGGTPDFAAQTVNGVTALTASLTPSLQLSYAAVGGDLLVSTALSGIADAVKGQHLDQSRDFKLVLGDRPKSPSAVVFFDLEKLLALADQAGLGSNPTYAAVRDDLQKIGAAGAYLERAGGDIDAELRLKNP